MKIKNKYIIIISLLFVFIPFFFLSGCNSTTFLIPGQKKAVINNLYAEYFNIGNAYFDLEKYDNAIVYYKKVLESSELYNAAYYKIGQCYVYKSDWANALPIYEDLLFADPENGSLKASVAYIYSMQGQFESALSIYEDLLNEQPNNEKYLENYLAIILSERNIFLENEKAFEEAFNQLKTNFPNNKNIKSFQERYESYLEK